MKATVLPIDRGELPVFGPKQDMIPVSTVDKDYSLVVSKNSTTGFYRWDMLHGTVNRYELMGILQSVIIDLQNFTPDSETS